MITEDYVSFEIAKLLKEKGFKFNNCSTYYTLHGEVCEIGKSQEIGIAPRPTLQMAMKWLREIHKLYMYTAFAGMEEVWFSRIYNRDKHLKDLDGFNTYEQACEEAIKYCLENLI